MLKLQPRNSVERWKKTVNQLTLEDLREYWEFHNRTEGKSEKTIAWYNEVLRKLERFLERERRSTFIKDIGEPEVRAFIHFLQNKIKWSDDEGRPTRGLQKLSTEGIQNRVRALKAFFNWLQQENYTEGYQLAGLKNFRVQKKIVETLSDDEIARVLASFDIKSQAGARNYAIISLMLDSGLRFSEVTTLKTADVDIEGGTLKVLGKGNKERIVPFGASTQKALWRLNAHFRSHAIDDEFFFLTDEGYGFSADGFKSLFRRIAQKSGVHRLHPHLCRHTFATRYLMSGGDLFSLQQILGHTSLEMVRRYVQLASQHVVVQHRKFSPMDRVMATARRKTA